MRKCETEDCIWEPDGKYARFCDRCRTLRQKERSADPKWKFSERMDDQIRMAYMERKDSMNSEIKSLPSLAEKWNYPLWSLKHRASKLGLTQTKTDPWSEAENKILYSYSWHTAKFLQSKLSEAGYSRTRTAIQNQITRLMIKGSDLDVFNAKSLALCFGVDSKAIIRLINRGYLRAERLGTDRPHDIFIIQVKDVVRFIREFPMEFDMRKVDQLWFLTIIFGGSLGKPKKRTMNARGEYAWT